MGVHVRKPEFGQRHHIIDNRTIVENTLVIKNGVKQNVTTYKKPSITEETCVAVFHGRPNPEQCMEDPPKIVPSKLLCVNQFTKSLPCIPAS